MVGRAYGGWDKKPLAFFSAAAVKFGRNLLSPGAPATLQAQPWRQQRLLDYPH